MAVMSEDTRAVAADTLVSLLSSLWQMQVKHRKAHHDTIEAFLGLIDDT